MNSLTYILIFSALLSGASCEKQPENHILPAPDPVVTQDEEEPVLTDRIYSISSGPGEDASSSMTVSWAVDAAFKAGTYVMYTTESDTKWKNAVKVMPEQNYFCSVFDGIWSKNAAGDDVYENARFTKYGTTLTGLKSDTDYKYVIKSEDGSQSREGKFRTAGATNWSCCIISDFHSYTPLPKRLTSSMGIIDRMQEMDPSLDWVLSPGDVVAWGGSYSFWKRFFEEENCVELMWARANGNHDNWTREANEVTKEYDIPNDYFKATSYYPQNGYGNEMGVCYHFRYANTLFVVLNTEDMHDGAEYKAAVEWTRNVITKAKSGSNPPQFTVVMMHYEWFYGTNGKSSEYSRWGSVFDQLGVDLAIAGNNHVYLRSYPIYGGKVQADGRGTVYLQTPASDNDRGREIDKDDFRNKDLISFRWTEGSHSVGAVHMEVKGRKMTLKLIDRNGKVLDQTEINAR